MQRLLSYFRDGLRAFGATIGMEVETSFLDSDSQPISVAQSQAMFSTLISWGWEVQETKGRLVTKLRDIVGNSVFYELGHQNIEVSSRPETQSETVRTTRFVLKQLYEAGAAHGLSPQYKPILETDEDLLVIPEERDATWLELDGREALAPLAKISAVQFTVEVPKEQAIPCLNRLGENIGKFLTDYPQEWVWREYIRSSRAGYRADRYGGPLVFQSLEDYCTKLCEHDVVQRGRLVPYAEVIDLDVGLFIRSVWWYFRLRRHNDRLCIEVRPMPRRTDGQFEAQLCQVLDIMNL